VAHTTQADGLGYRIDGPLAHICERQRRADPTARPARAGNRQEKGATACKVLILKTIHRSRRSYVDVYARMRESELAKLICSAYRFSINSSTDTPACFKIPDKVPTLISLWFGTTQPELPRLITIWLPFWRATVKPSFWSAETHSRPLIRGSLGMGHFECRHEGRRNCFRGKFLKV
jgi:hypothetical protein